MPAALERIYGRNPVAEAKRGRRRVHRVWTSADTPAPDLERLAGSPDHQGIVAEVDPYPYADPGSLLAAPGAFVVALDQVQDPRNLGAVCRSAEAAGAAGAAAASEAPGNATAVMCSEGLWWRCHRRIIADFAVLARGADVLHLLPDGRLVPHPPTEGARLRDDVLAKDKLTRGDKVRTYNFPQDRCTDHRSGVTVHNLPDVMLGGGMLDKVMQSVGAWMMEREIKAMLKEEELKDAEAAKDAADTKSSKS